VSNSGGLVVSRSPEKLRENLTSMLEDASNDLSGLARLVIDEAYGHYRDSSRCQARFPGFFLVTVFCLGGT